MATQDNIGPANQPGANPVPNVNVGPVDQVAQKLDDHVTDEDTHYKLFDDHAAFSSKLDALMKKLPKAQHDQERVQLLAEMVKHLIEQQKKGHDLMVSMNNMMAK